MEGLLLDFERLISQANDQIEVTKPRKITLQAQLSTAIQESISISKDFEVASAKTLDLERQIRGKSQKVISLKNQLKEATNQ